MSTRVLLLCMSKLAAGVSPVVKPAVQPGQPVQRAATTGVPKLPTKPAVPAAVPKPVAQPTTSAAQAGYVQPNLTQHTPASFRDALQSKQ